MGKDVFNNKYRIKSIRLPEWDYRNVGYYFITICTKDRRHYFGNVKNEEMILSEVGLIANQFRLEIPKHFSHVSLDEFIVMPNHIHGIISIDEKFVETPHGASPLNESHGASPLNESHGASGLNELHGASPLNESHGASGLNELHGASPKEEDEPCGASQLNKNETQKNKIQNETRHVCVPACRQAGLRTKNEFGPQNTQSLGYIINQFKGSVTREINKQIKDGKISSYKTFARQSRFYEHVIRNEKDYGRIYEYIQNNPLQWNDDEYYSA